VVAHLIEAGKLTLEDVEFAEKTLRESESAGQRGSEAKTKYGDSSLRSE
jgi:hypothetical protein